ncbi:MAG: Gfo/Idh/MocA family oxidoreductase [SAR324 cluster bacterium]|nr:Gfo/Idh/MocA family oxidoreductase [SAR324 cluster bacterium]
MSKGNDKNLVAVFGCGYWGKNLVRNFHELGALRAIADPDEKTAHAMAKQYGAAAETSQQILSDPSVSGIVIAAPAELHFELASQALHAGKHVFVEKPLALQVEQAEQLVRIAEAGQRSLMVGHLLQYHPAFLRLKDLVHAGELGRIQYVYSNRLNLGKVRREENILWSFAPHDISMILSIFGEEPKSVYARGSRYLHKEIADVTTTHMTFASGGNAHVFVSWLHPFKEQKLIVVGEKGMAVFDDGQTWESKLTLYPHSIEWKAGVPEPNRSEALPVPLEEQEPLKLECQHFLDCMSNGTRPRTDGNEGVRVLRVLQAAERSMAEQGPAPAQRHAQGRPAQPAPEGVFVHESAFVDQPSTIGAGTRIWHFSHVLSGSNIGRDCIIGQNVMIGPDVTVGQGCKIQNNVSIYTGITLEDGVFCGPSCVFTNVNNPRAGIERKDEFRPTLVKRGATIGANATIVCGATIGVYAFIAAGAVVTSDVPPHALMAGVPARRIGWMSHAGEKLADDLICPREGRSYQETAPERLEEIVD